MVVVKDTQYIGVGDGIHPASPSTRNSSSTSSGAVAAPRFKQVLSFAVAGSALGLGYVPLSAFTAAEQPQQRTFGVVVCISTLWVSAPVPAFVTALLVPVLVVVTGCLRADVCDGSASAGDYVAPIQICGENRTQAHPDSGAGAGFVLMTRRQAALTICSSMWQPIVLLFLSGFVIAAAIDKHRISQRLIKCVMSLMDNAAQNGKSGGEQQHCVK